MAWGGAFPLIFRFMLLVPKFIVGSRDGLHISFSGCRCKEYVSFLAHYPIFNPQFVEHCSSFANPFLAYWNACHNFIQLVMAILEGRPYSCFHLFTSSFIQLVTISSVLMSFLSLVGMPKLNQTVFELRCSFNHVPKSSVIFRQRI